MASNDSVDNETGDGIDYEKVDRSSLSERLEHEAESVRESVAELSVQIENGADLPPAEIVEVRRQIEALQAVLEHEVAANVGDMKAYGAAADVIPMGILAEALGVDLESVNELRKERIED